MSTAALPLLACCAPGGEALDADAAERLATRLKAVADPMRLRLLSLIASHEDGEACVCDLVTPLGLSQPTVSHHLRVLVEAGLVGREQRGRWAYYRLERDALRGLGEALTLG